LKNPIPYLRFRRKATNRHGVHSPFIYSLLEDAIYKKDKKKESSTKIKRTKEQKLFLRLLNFNKPNTAFILEPNTYYNQVFTDYQLDNPSFSLKKLSSPSSLQNSFDVFVLNNIGDHKILLSFLETLVIKNTSFVIIPQIRASKQQLEFWQTIIKKDYAKVCLEFYRFGLVFFREECSKEYFKIRF